MSNLIATIATIAALVVSALFGACIGFFAGRLFPANAERLERKERKDRPEPTAERPPPCVVRGPGTAPAVLPTPAIAASHIVEAELSDTEIDALPADLPFLARPRPRIASPPRTRALDRL
ncbi:hypothetical protein ACSFA3_00625 [Variovorax sp. RHLX14]|uniref:hypothetical protein n=1 Tax=Variovorax sp. RHLX14 TaxID=1259731 RepID=UPI003F474B08